MRKVERCLRDRIKALEAELSKVKMDREQFRAFMADDMRKMIDLCGKGQHFSSATWIERISKRMQHVEWWYW